MSKDMHRLIDGLYSEFNWIPENLVMCWIKCIPIKHKNIGFEKIWAALYGENRTEVEFFIIRYKSLKEISDSIPKTWPWDFEKKYKYAIMIMAIMLSIEVLGNDFAGWGERFPEERQRAMDVLERYFSSNKTRLIDIYMPDWATMDQTELKRVFDPHQIDI